MLRENRLGVAIAPMEDVKISAYQKQDDGTIVKKDVLVRQHTVIRVGIEYVADRDDQISVVKAVTFKAMVPDKDGILVQTDFTLDKGTAIKIGTAKWEPGGTIDQAAPPEAPK